MAGYGKAKGLGSVARKETVSPRARSARARYQISVPLAEVRAAMANSASFASWPSERSTVAAALGPQVEAVDCKLTFSDQ